MTIDDFRKSPEFQALSGKQRDYLLAYIECEQDKDAAAKKVWPESKYPTADGYQVYRNSKVQRAIKLFYNLSDKQPDRDRILTILGNSIESGGQDQLKAIQIYIKLKGWDSTPPEPEEPTEPPKDYSAELEQYGISYEGRREGV